MSPDDERSPLSIGIDIGGTFTDFVVYDHDAGDVQTFKVLSTPADPAQAVLEGLRRLSPATGRSVVHGSTVATNALLERKGGAYRVHHDPGVSGRVADRPANPSKSL